jgi:hypothetical protein
MLIFESFHLTKLVSDYLITVKICSQFSWGDATFLIFDLRDREGKMLVTPALYIQIIWPS